MNKKIFFAICLMLAMLAGNATAQTQIPVKIGYCNPEYILSVLPEAKQIERELEIFEKQLQAQMDSKIAEIKRKYEEYQRIAQDPAVPMSIKQDKEKELMQLEQSIKDYEEKAQQDLQLKQMQLLQPVLEKIQKSIDKVAETNGYTYILNTHEISGSAIILYARYKTDDISELVLKDLGVTPPPAGGTTGTNSGSTGGSTAPAPAAPAPAPARPMAPTR